jgi:PST family polysaccharide transporter
MTLIMSTVAPQIATWYGQNDLHHLLTAVGIAMLAYSFRAIPLGLLERSMSYGRVALIEVIDILTFSAIAVLGVATGFGLWALSAAILMRSLASLGAAYALEHLPDMRLGLSLRALRQMLGYAVPYTLANGLTWLNTAAAPILVGTFVGTREFGVLQMSYTLIVFPQVLTGIIGRVSFPVYARERHADLLAARVNSGTIALTRYAGGATLLLAVTSLIWIPFLYGQEWTGMSRYMLVIAPVYALEKSLALIIAALSASGKVILLLATGLAFSLIYWTSAVALVPTIGGLGLPTAYAFASLSFLSYVAIYRGSVGPIRIGGALLEFTVLCLLLAVAAALSVTNGQMVGIALLGLLMATLVLRHVPLTPQRRLPSQG